MNQVKFVLRGISPLLMHADDYRLQEELVKWRKDPANKNISAAGDDRCPPWTWKASVYTDGERVTIPSDNLSTCLRSAGAQIKAGRGQGAKSLKSATQSGMLILDEHLAILIDGKELSAAAVNAIDGDFDAQCAAAERLGFSLFVKRAKIQNAKHIRVRPRFDEWSIEGTLQVMAPEFTFSTLEMLFSLAGGLVGLGDWRPSSPKSPGPFGRFSATLSEV